jgi:Na+/melibiose symporter-like transporter
LVPSLCNIIAFFIALAYPINSSMHKDIRLAIAQQKKGRTVTNPLKPAQSPA